MSPTRPWLTPLVPLYRLGLIAREAMLRTGLEPVRRLQWPVVSIGNLSTGGTGKTPLTIALARALTQRGVHVDVLSRGYGRRSALPLRVDPRGTAEDFGDEPILIARDAGVPVYVAARRYEAGLLAERDIDNRPSIRRTDSPGSAITVAEEQEVSGHDLPGSPATGPGRRGGLSRAIESPQLSGALAPEEKPLRVHLLDDGFQHRQLHRDINILLLNANDLEDKLLPAGNLREPLSAVRHADILALPAQEAPSLEPALRQQGWQGPVWRLQRAMSVPQIGSSIGGPVVAFCGIARSEQFFDGLRNAGLQLAGRIAFPDHHRYIERDLDRLLTAARAAGAFAFITTEKDRVRLGALGAKLAERCPVRTAQLEIAIEEEDAAMDSLMSRLSAALECLTPSGKSSSGTKTTPEESR